MLQATRWASNSLAACTCSRLLQHSHSRLAAGLPTPTRAASSLAERLAARRAQGTASSSSQSPPAAPPPSTTATEPFSPDVPPHLASPAPSSPSPKPIEPLSIDNTTPTIHKLVRTAIGAIPLPTAAPARSQDASQKKSRNLKRKAQASVGKAGAQGDEGQRDSASGPSSAQEARRETHPLSLAEKRRRFEERIERMEGHLLEPWDSMTPRAQELRAWRMEMAEAAKEKQAFLQAEKDLDKPKHILSSAFSQAPPPPSRTTSGGPPDVPRREHPNYQYFEDKARRRHEEKRENQIFSISSYQGKIATIDRQIEQQLEHEAAKAVEQRSSKAGGKSRPSQPSLLTTFADKLKLGDAEGKGKGRRRGSWEPREISEMGKEELAEQLHEVLPSPEMAKSAGVPYKRAPRREARPRSYGERLAAEEARARDARPPPVLPPLSTYPRTLSANSTAFAALPRDETVPIASLAHGLTRVLFNPGVHFLRDPRSGVYNFPRRALEQIPPVEEFELGKMPEYVTSSRDKVLGELAKKEGKMFVGSTSSTVALLCQIYFWISKGKGVNIDMLSAPWRDLSTEFSAGQRLPASVVLHYRGVHYAIDADKSMDSTINLNVLADYGHMMEKLLTTEADEFERFLKTSTDPAPSLVDERQAYQYSTTEHMVLRSQLDAHDEHLPRVSFDVKTRGSVAVRQDRLNYVEAAGYDVHTLQGPWESFEREYYDLVRSAFLKYQFQARIGGMDGCFVAYHSTQRFFGFQYVPIEEMDVALFGTTETGQEVFRLALGFLETILMEAKACYPEQSVRMTLAAGEMALRGMKADDVLRVFVSPLEEPAKVEGEDAPAQELTLLEFRGTNYLDGEPQEQVEIRPKKAQYQRLTRAEEEAGAAPSPISAEDDLPTWQVGYKVTKSSNADAPTFTHGEREASGRVPPHEVNRLFAATREFQAMFSSLTLPSGVSRADVVAAAQRQAKQASEAEESGGGEVDPSDLAVRFPMRDGMDYRSKPSFGVKELRIKAREGKRRIEEREELAKEEGKPMVEVQSRKRVWE